MSWERDVDILTAAVIKNLDADTWDNDPIEVLHHVEMFKDALKHVKSPSISDTFKTEYTSHKTKDSNWLYQWIVDCLLDHKYGKPHPQWPDELQNMTVQERAAWAIKKYAECYKMNVRTFQYSRT